MIVVVRSYWPDYTSPKSKSMGDFFNLIIEMKFSLPNLLTGARGAGDFSAAPP